MFSAMPAPKVTAGTSFAESIVPELKHSLIIFSRNQNYRSPGYLGLSN